MLKKGFLLSSKSKNWRLTKQENGIGLATPQENSLSQRKVKCVSGFTEDDLFSPQELGMTSHVPLVVNPNNLFEMEEVCMTGGDIGNCSPSNQNGDKGINTSHGGCGWSRSDTKGKLNPKQSGRRKKQVILRRNSH
ncbi:hypothetical protein LOK49_LG10G01060 [Camellia lanceoleosa]|uniref:Uncharacterized protein n=1 Tax=Camellia lanceoleosa TaxID=1840588 RepID=A0ACC0GCA2_9ERIC|nr:hypothetical protein LOK49_LG10G01060 [Camellia lanceoleosa]